MCVINIYVYICMFMFSGIHLYMFILRGGSPTSALLPLDEGRLWHAPRFADPFAQPLLRAHLLER